jgi:hypothetical protein
MKAVADTLAVARSNLIELVSRRAKWRRPYRKAGDDELTIWLAVGAPCDAGATGESGPILCAGALDIFCADTTAKAARLRIIKAAMMLITKRIVSSCRSSMLAILASAPRSWSLRSFMNKNAVFNSYWP